MCIKFHLIYTKKVFENSAFLGALVLWLLTKLVQNSRCINRRCSFSNDFFNYEAKLALNAMLICPHGHQIGKKLVQIRYHNGAGTKMHKCLVEM